LVQSGETVYYRVEPMYLGSNPLPVYLKIIVATRQGSFLIIIENRP
jgi:hypothetical protein